MGSFVPQLLEASATVTEISTAFTTGFTQIASDLTSLVSAIIPIALPVAGVCILIRFGMRAFHSIGSV